MVTKKYLGLLIGKPPETSVKSQAELPSKNMNLDVDFYKGWYPDLSSMSESSLRKHWNMFGKAEGRYSSFEDLLSARGFTYEDLPSEFDADTYGELNPDLLESGPLSEWHLKAHYIEFGRKEGRRYGQDISDADLGVLPDTTLDTLFYKSWYPDLANMDDEALRNHWISFGKQEDRYPSFEYWLSAHNYSTEQVPADFDADSYRQLYVDLLELDNCSDWHLKAHYLEHGHKEGRYYRLKDFLAARQLDPDTLPSKFNWRDYIAINKDVVGRHVVTHADAAVHYLTRGRDEGLACYFDHVFFQQYYLAGDVEKKEKDIAFRKWLLKSKVDHCSPNFEHLLSRKGFKHAHSYDWEFIDIGYIRKNNLALGQIDDWRLRLLIIESAPNYGLNIPNDCSVAQQLALRLGNYFQLECDFNRAIACYGSHESFEHNATVAEKVAHCYAELKQFEAAVKFYRKSIECGSCSYKCFYSLVEILRERKAYPDLIEIIRLAAERFPGNSAVERLTISILEEVWNNEHNLRLTQLAWSDSRSSIINHVDSYVREYVDIWARFLVKEEDSWAARPNAIRSILIVADLGLPQCKRYRVDQKVAQLKLAGYDVVVQDWQKLRVNCEALLFSDAVICYRTPAFPRVVKLILSARILGKITFYEIDDLIFDPVYPPPIQSYGGLVSSKEYTDLVRGMSLYRAAATLCDFGIASTRPLAEYLKPLTQNRHCYIHRNGLDYFNDCKSTQDSLEGNEEIIIFYGSGTRAHNSDFVELVLPALSLIFGKYKHVRLVVVGNLILPNIFLEEYKNKIRIIPATKDINAYYSYLSGAHINIAVLSDGKISDCKSELKWFEAACYSIPSIVSDTANYRDVIRDGVDGLLVSSLEDWVRALSELVEEATKRMKIGAEARYRIIQDYSLANLSSNIDTIFRDAALRTIKNDGKCLS